jgi:hypothetical protein
MYRVGSQSSQLSALHKSKNTTDNPKQFTSKDHLSYLHLEMSAVNHQ